jgi:para-nitrobenzyl esterase
MRNTTRPMTTAVVVVAGMAVGTQALGQAMPAPSTPPTLAGTAWRLVRFEGGDGAVRAPADPARYTLAFAGADTGGPVLVRLDCNRGRGSWRSPAPGRLGLGPLALTRAMCPPGADGVRLGAQLARHWAAVRSYLVRDGGLVLSLAVDGGTYEWAPDSSARVPGHPVAPPASPPARPAPPAPSPTGEAAPFALVVRTAEGAVRGAAAGDVLTFKGIPYAAPPVGELRWRPPQPAAAWTALRDARRFGRDCMQLPLPGDAASSGAPRAEDCLALNVWRPAAARAGERLPVLVWIHGGGFLNGAASVPMFDGAQFARAGLVVVSMNYRLGRLGFFAHPALTAEARARGEPTANYGLLDQLAALRWVRRNASAFGGDSAQVTVMGESAGGISIVHLLTWPAARGLFHRAVVLSGGGRAYGVETRKLRAASAGPDGRPLPSAEASGVAFAESRRVRDTTAAGLRRLRSIAAVRVNGLMSMLDLALKPPSYTGGIVDDGGEPQETVDGLPGPHFARGNVAVVPLLIGTTGDDLAADARVGKDDPLAFFGADSAVARALYGPAAPEGRPTATWLARAVGADVTMQEPARFVARRLSALGAPVWRYRFDYVPVAQRPRVTSTPHAGELAFLFDQLSARYGRKVTAQDRAVARAFHGYVASFARTGDPNGAGRPSWPRVTGTAADSLLLVGGDGRVGAARDPWTARLDLVERVVERSATSDTGSTTSNARP